ncbi:hypothetical protein DYQ95_00640 [Xanthomonas sp. LMG 9002]|nr:hypothetical protein [Xanthomonas sp. LMG 9002]
MRPRELFDVILINGREVNLDAVFSSFQLRLIEEGNTVLFYEFFEPQGVLYDSFGKASAFDNGCLCGGTAGLSSEDFLACLQLLFGKLKLSQTKGRKNGNSDAAHKIGKL